MDLDNKLKQEISQDVFEMLTDIKEKYELTDVPIKALVEVFQASVKYHHEKINEITRRLDDEQRQHQGSIKTT